MRFRLFAGFFLGFTTTGIWGSSFALNPWILIFEPQNRVISQVVTFTYQGEGPEALKKQQGPAPDNAQNAPVPVEINISAREITLEGSVTYPSNAGADDFVVYPSQFILYPGDTKKIQVQWVGASVPTREMTFGFIATQLPLNLKEETEQPKRPIGRVLLQTRYEGIIVVRPSGVKPAVVVDTAYSRHDSAGTSLVFILNNKGTIKFNERFPIKEIKASNATAQSLFPGFRRMVAVPWPSGYPVVPVIVTAMFPDAPK
jgi:P pilus assembly chaperone PapD